MRSINLNPSHSVGGALSILLAIFLAPLGNVTQVFAHEFEDGHVERSLSFVVQDRKVSVEYAVGCNTQTMTALLNQWSESPGNETGSTKLSSSTPRPLTEQELKIETAFQTAVLAEIARQLEITCNGERVSLKPVSVELSPRHHVNAVARLEFNLPMADKIRLIARDVLFPDNGGAVKYALKPKNSTILSKSNVAPILIRAERTELYEISPEIRAQKTTVDCELSFLPTKK